MASTTKDPQAIAADELRQDAKDLLDQFNKDLSRLLGSKMPANSAELQRIKESFYLAGLTLNSINKDTIRRP